MDYRYFPDPDLPPLVVSDEMLARIKAGMPELPEAKCSRFSTQYGLSHYDALLLSQDGATARYYEEAMKEGAPLGLDPKLLANWMLGAVAAALNRDEITIDLAPVRPVGLAGILWMLSQGKLNNSQARALFDLRWREPRSGDVTVALTGIAVHIEQGQVTPNMASQLSSLQAEMKAQGFEQITDGGTLEKIVDEVLAKSAAQIADYKAGKEKALMSIVGMVMKASQGKANPAQVNDIVRRKLA